MLCWAFLPQLPQYYSVAIRKLFLLFCIALWCVFKGVIITILQLFFTPSSPKKLVRTEAPSFWSANTACLITCKWSPAHLSSDLFMIYSHAPLCPPALSKLLKTNSALILKILSCVVLVTLKASWRKGRTRLFPQKFPQLIFQAQKTQVLQEMLHISTMGVEKKQFLLLLISINIFNPFNQ